jgi:uncharacterized membrane protein YphA (DoxX/SURF4 family)
MKKLIYFIEFYAPAVLRYGMAAVILWFGLSQLFNASQWIAYIPDSITSLTGLSATTLVYFNATFELIFGLLLVFGWQTRIVALLLALHLFDIMYTVGYGEIGVRDFGLAIATLVVSMNGKDALSIQQKNLIIKPNGIKI